MGEIERVCVLGAGSWGTTVASLFAHRVPTYLWARSLQVADEIDQHHTNTKYLGDIELSPSLRSTHDLELALSGCSLVVLAVPSHGLREIVTQASKWISHQIPILSLTKGIEAGSNMRMTQIVEEQLASTKIGFLTGPNLAREVIEGQPTASVIASNDEGLSHEIQRLLHSKTMRVYRNSDIVGSEIAGALKNVMAIAAGMAEGLGFGDNSRAALITRSLAEIGRLGVRLGGRPMTFAGLAGLGDLVATCTSVRSRNHSVGRMLGQGFSLEEILAKMNMVAEGVKTAPVVVELGRSNGVEMPISYEIARVLSAEQNPSECVANLLGRSAGEESEGMEL